MGVRVARFREVTPLSQSECERFEADLQTNAALRAEADKAWADTSPLAAMVALAVSKGYGVTVEKALEHVKAKAAAAGKVLSDADLDGVAAGSDVSASNALLQKLNPGGIGVSTPGMPSFNF
jgi:hypothetical protein